MARLRFEPDARRVRELLAQVDAVVADRDALGRRRVRLLVGEILGRLVQHCPQAPVQLDLELKADSVRIDIAVGGGECDFWDAVDDVVFTDLTTGWGRDRRREAGAWFEVAAIPERAHRPAAVESRR